MVSKTTLGQKAERVRSRPFEKPLDKIAAIADQVLDGTLEATFPAIDPTAVPSRRIGKPRRPK